MATASATAKLSVWRGLPPDAPIEARLSALEANIETLKAEQAETSKKLQEEKKKRVESLDSERRSRESADVELRTRVDTLGAGGTPSRNGGIVLAYCWCSSWHSPCRDLECSKVAPMMPNPSIH